MQKGYRSSSSNTRVATTITEEQHAHLRLWAKRNNINMAHLLRLIIGSAIAEHDITERYD